MSPHLRLPRSFQADGRPRLPDQDGAWIAEGRRAFADFSVGSLVPVAFPRYGRMLHPACAADGAPVRWTTVAGWAGTRTHTLAQWELLSRSGVGPGETAPFQRPPETGGLPATQLAVLCDLLRDRTTTPDRCFIGMWEGYGQGPDSAWATAPVLKLDQRTFLVRTGPIDLVPTIGRPESLGAMRGEPPTIFWPADRAWFVASDPDLDSTYVGGSNALIESLLGCPELEAWAAGADDLVSIGSDVVNA